MHQGAAPVGQFGDGGHIIQVARLEGDVRKRDQHRGLVYGCFQGVQVRGDVAILRADTDNGVLVAEQTP
jgi:hypothetical protein